MRPFVIELVTEVIEALLLMGQGGGRRIRGFGLERLVHPLMAAVLLGLARLDALRPDAQLDPPDPEPAKPARTERGEGGAIIGADRARQAVLAKHPLQLRAAAVIVRMRQDLRAQQVAAEGVAHGERITARVITGAEPALKIDTPKIIGVPQHGPKWSLLSAKQPEIEHRVRIKLAGVSGPDPCGRS